LGIARVHQRPSTGRCRAASWAVVVAVGSHGGGDRVARGDGVGDKHRVFSDTDEER
jgi:hypothetical protein